MSPAGNWIMLKTAVKCGADAVYFGIEKFNMRAKANNFVLADLPKIVNYCKKFGVKSYLTLNTFLREENLKEVHSIILKAQKSGIDMIICWDFAVIELCRRYDIPFCVSTQASVSNSKSLNFFENLGAKRVVLARECTLKEIKEIRKKTSLEIEVFVHGAMCVAVSGRCFMSHHTFGKSANEGDCLQPCRREYLIKDTEIDSEYILGTDYVMSAKDLCSVGFIDKLIELGINSFKIEGRKRSPEYVAKVTSVYRQAIDNYFEKKLTDEIKQELINELAKVYNRGFSKGFYFGEPDGNDFSNAAGSIASEKKEYIGNILNYYKKLKVAYLDVKSNSLKAGSKVLIIGQTTGLVELKINQILDENKEIQEAVKGMKVTFKCDELVREGDKVYILIEQNVCQKV